MISQISIRRTWLHCQLNEGCFMVRAFLAIPLPGAFSPGSLKGGLRGRAESQGLLASILAFAPLSGMCRCASPWNGLLCLWRVLGGDVPASQGSTQGRAGTSRRPSPSEPEEGIWDFRSPVSSTQIWLPLCVQENRVDLGAFGPWLLAAMLKCERWERSDVSRVCYISLAGNAKASPCVPTPLAARHPLTPS